MPATVSAERVGWERSIRVLRDRVAALRPVYLPPDPSGRTAYAPGEVAHFDLWFPPVTFAGRVRAATDTDAVASPDDGAGLLPMGRRGADPVPPG